MDKSYLEMMGERLEKGVENKALKIKRIIK